MSFFAASGNAKCVLYLDPSHAYCFAFVDEAAQASEVATYGALLAMRRGGVAVLIGGQEQSRPYVDSQIARDKRIGISLFEKLFHYDGIP